MNTDKPTKSSALALIPFLVFAVFYVGLSLVAQYHYKVDMPFYAVPMPIAFLVASATALFLGRRNTLTEKIDTYAVGMGDTNIMIMCLIFILAGCFTAVAKEMGAVQAAVAISQAIIPPRLILAGTFLISCIIATSIGTSCGTIAAITPIAAGLCQPLGINPAVMVGAVVGGAMFGDNLSMISDTTIAATRTQGIAMREKFIANFRIALPAALLTLVIYGVAGFSSDKASGDISAGEPATAAVVCADSASPDATPAAAVESDTAEATAAVVDTVAETAVTPKDDPQAGSSKITFKQIVLVLPYILILVLALSGMNVMLVLFLGTALATLVGYHYHSFGVISGLDLIGKGALGMSETLIVAILAGGLLGLVRKNGGVQWIVELIEKSVGSIRGCEFGVAFLVSAVNLFTANNTVAIVIAGPIAKTLSDKFRCRPARIASILDTMSCVVQGIIPYGAQLLIATSVAKGVGVNIDVGSLIGHLYYQWLLFIAVVISIVVFGRKARQ